MKIDHVVAEMDRTGGGTFYYIAAERSIESEHRSGVLHRKGDMIEAPDASRLLSGERADTDRPANGRAGRGRTPDKSASGRFVCHVASPASPLPGDQRAAGRCRRQQDRPRLPLPSTPLSLFSRPDENPSG
jgi:hypothetical protein